jgi:cell division septation protein DedD
MEKGMRDLDKIRESYEFNMEGAQLKLLILGAAAICLLVFVLGFLVGRRFPPEPAPREYASRAAAPGSLSDREAGGKGSAPGIDFEFYEKLSGKSSDGKNSRPEPEPEAIRKEFSPPGEPVTQPDVEAEPAQVVSPTRPAMDAENAVVAVPPEPPAPSTSQTPKVFTSLYTVQVSAFEEPSGAEKLADQLKQKGYASYTQVKTIPGKGTWYRVRVGRYEGRAEAESTAKILEEREGASPFITLYVEN